MPARRSPPSSSTIITTITTIITTITLNNGPRPKAALPPGP
ncbi:MAG: hypothetical protein ABSC88_10415 [Terracidiphilus sp.]